MKHIAPRLCVDVRDAGIEGQARAILPNHREYPLEPPGFAEL
jgi:hypothetical protein